VRLLTLILALGPGAQAAGPQEPQSSVSVTGLVRSSADIDGGGDFYVNSFRASATLGGSIAPRITASAGVKYAYENWRFGTPGTLGPVAPWSEVQGPSFDLSVSYRYSDQLAFFLGPQVGWTYETGASASDALSYGAAIGASFGPIGSPAELVTASALESAWSPPSLAEAQATRERAAATRRSERTVAYRATAVPQHALAISCTYTCAI